MAEHKRIRRDKSEESAGKHQTIKKMQQQLHDQVKAADEGMVDFLEPSLEKQATLLASAHSDEQRANLITHWQRSYGNSYVQRLLSSRVVQAKLTVNPPDDIYEREADRVADEVTQTPASEIQRQPMEEEEELMMKPASEIQRQPMEEEEELMMKPASEIQRQPMEEEELLQGKAADSQTPTVSEDLETRINTARGSGQALDDRTRGSLEPQFGRDFDQVRIHTDTEADKLSRQLGAEAFTTGHDVFFSEDAYQPDSERGKGLIAHELTHVVQQSAAPVIQRDAVEATSTTATETTTTTGAAAEAPATAALRALWESMVVSPVQEAHSVLATSGPATETARQASELLGRSVETINTIRPHYRENEATYGRLNWVHSRLETIKVGLLAHTSETVSMEELTANVEPSSAVVTNMMELSELL